jgi:hypothetical protein
MSTRISFGIRPPRLHGEQRLSVYAVGLGLWATGALWLLLHYFFAQETPFGPSPHPLEFWSRAAHGAFGFAALWLFGMLWGTHIVDGWRSLRRRWSGSAMFAIFAWLVVSGYLLYYLGGEQILAITTFLHWSIGLACPLPFLLHRFAASLTKRVAASERPS